MSPHSAPIAVVLLVVTERGAIGWLRRIHAAVDRAVPGADTDLAQSARAFLDHEMAAEHVEAVDERVRAMRHEIAPGRTIRDRGKRSLDERKFTACQFVRTIQRSACTSAWYS
jgi:hypothetical protein